GRQLEVPMLETMTHFLSVEHLNGLTWQHAPAPSGYRRLLNAYRRPHRTRDGYLAVMPHSESQWRKFFTAVGRPDVLSDPRMATPARHWSRRRSASTRGTCCARWAMRKVTSTPWRKRGR